MNLESLGCSAESTPYGETEEVKIEQRLRAHLRDEEPGVKRGDEGWSDSGYTLKNYLKTKHLEGEGMGIRNLLLDVKV